MKLDIHTIRFSKDYFPDYESCAAWLVEKSISDLGYVEVENFYIFKQVSKEKFNDASLQEISLGSGVSGVVGVITNSDNTLANITDAEAIIASQVNNGEVGSDISASAEKKTQLLALLSSTLEAVKDFISKENSTTTVEGQTKPDVQFHVPIIKKTTQKIVFGEVLVPDTVDGQGHIYSEEEVEKAAHYWMKEFQQVGEMHKKMLSETQAIVLESYVAPVDFDMGNRPVKKGTWLLKMYIEDDKLWEKIESGEYTGFSIQGLADAETLDEDE